MESPMRNLVNGVATFIPNTHLSLHLEGWPAAVSIVAICGAGVGAYALAKSSDKAHENERLNGSDEE